jgi:metal-responsive CopG/Arc/MetJ family transcriptional regulator
MTTIRISLDDHLMECLDRIALETNQSRSKVVRDMIAWYELRATVNTMSQTALAKDWDTPEEDAAWAHLQ